MENSEQPTKLNRAFSKIMDDENPDSSPRSICCRVIFFIYVVIFMVVCAASSFLAFFLPTGEDYYAYLRIFMGIVGLVIIVFAVLALVGFCCTAKFTNGEILIVIFLVVCEVLFMPYIHAAAYSIISSTMHLRYLVVDEIEYQFEYQKKFAPSSVATLNYEGKCNSHRFDYKSINRDSTYLIILGVFAAIIGVAAIFIPLITHFFLTNNRTRLSFAISATIMQAISAVFLISDLLGSTVFGHFDALYYPSLNQVYRYIFIAFIALYVILTILGFALLFARNTKAGSLLYEFYKVTSFIVSVAFMLVVVAFIITHLIVYFPGRNNRPPKYDFTYFQTYNTDIRCRTGYCEAYCTVKNAAKYKDSDCPAVNGTAGALNATCADQDISKTITFLKSAWHANMPANAVAFVVFALIYNSLIMAQANRIPKAYRIVDSRVAPEDADDEDSEEMETPHPSSDRNGVARTDDSPAIGHPIPPNEAGLRVTELNF
ncbi:hypothetical protein BLNAU_10055 [Blattamonas nauphoetae]|uniref:Uncharacterized protein n=1 Tax=Blattamonas nauphoetae TaxID=2049346 RepID=A0ABQ9XTW4_9EUKA|nr:hypothetical protein BLNAU_10055 [Blattamonas nauphoetae]